jgi:hypothetical protein
LNLHHYTDSIKFKYYDRDIIEKAATTMGIPVLKFEEFGDKKLSAFDRMVYPLGIGNGVLQANIYEAERKIICGMAEEGNCIIVGRCSDFVLRDAGYKTEDMINLFFYASYEQRKYNSMNNLGLDIDQAVEYLDRIGEARERYYKQHSFESFTSIRYRNLMIDTAIMDEGKLVDWLSDLAVKKFGLEIN